ncbi:MAG: hypothetical protein E6Q97_24490 [Desulfurellales bacterium]|nr:MAG: hypothetical protein E6Q97_24490 [Desulfurellales bacterium]
MTTPVVIKGKNCKLYYNSGTYASPTWVEVKNVKDLTLTLTYDEAEVSTRGGGKQYEPTLLDSQIEFEMVRDTADSVQTALLAAFENQTVLDLAVAEGAIATNGTKYYRDDYKIFSSPHNEALADVKRIPLTFKPCYSENASGFFTVSA